LPDFTSDALAKANKLDLRVAVKMEAGQKPRVRVAIACVSHMCGEAGQLESALGERVQ